MKGGRRWKTWEQMEHKMAEKIDEHAAELWVHPGEAMDGAEAGVGNESARGAGPSGSEFADMFARIMSACLPPRSYGDVRRWQAGYHRMCAFCFRLAPEMFEGATRKEIADGLGLSLRAFGKQLEAVDEILAARRTIPQPTPPPHATDDR